MHVDCNSRLATTRGRLWLDFTDENSCLICGPNTPTTVPYKFSATPDGTDLFITKYCLTTVYLTTCSPLSSDHLPILFDTRCRSSFHNPLDRLNLRTDMSYDGLRVPSLGVRRSLPY